MENNSKILRLNKGDEIVSSILKYCEEKNIDSAWIWGIGAISEISLSAYDLNNKKYIDKKINDNLEISSLSGNIGKHKGKIVAHLHGVFSDRSMSCFGGHITAAIVAATCEIIINPVEFKIIREHNEEIGLNLIQQ